MASRFRVFLPALALLVVFGAGGCAKDKNPVNGQVTFEGTPVKWGYVQFTPDIDKKNDGPTVTLQLDEEGRFSSAKEGKGMVTGAHTVLVSATYDVGPKTVERQYDVDVPLGGKGDINFNVVRKPKKKAVPKGPPPAIEVDN